MVGRDFMIRWLETNTSYSFEVLSNFSDGILRGLCENYCIDNIFYSSI